MPGGYGESVERLSRRRLLWIGAGVIACIGVLVVGAGFLNRVFADYRETPWEPLGVSEDERTITIEYVADEGACDSFDRVDRTEMASTVALTVVLRTRGENCPDISIHYTREVELERPLGDRQLIDGRTGLAPRPRGDL